MEIGEVIRKLRLEKSMGQKELSELMGVGRNAVSMWESGVRYPSREKMEKLAELFNVDLDYMYGKSPIRNKVTFDDHDNLNVFVTPDEMRLIQAYNIADSDTQKTIDRLLEYSMRIRDLNNGNT